MSRSYGCNIAVGFRADERSFEALARAVPERSHFVTKYDPDTGTPREVKIVDESAHDSWTYDGVEYDDFLDAARAVGEDMAAKGIPCEVFDFFNEGESFHVVFGLDLEEADDGVDDYPVEGGGSLSYEAAVAGRETLDKIKRFLEELSIKVPEPRIHLVWSIG